MKVGIVKQAYSEERGRQLRETLEKEAGRADVAQHISQYCPVYVIGFSGGSLGI